MDSEINHGSALRLIVVDPDPVARRLVALVFTLADYQVLAVPCLPSIDAVAAFAPDVVVLDPAGGGWSAARGLRADRRTAGVPIVICTLATREVAAVADRPIGRGVAVVFKPFRITELRAVVARLVDATNLAPAAALGVSAGDSFALLSPSCSRTSVR